MPRHDFAGRQSPVLLSSIKKKLKRERKKIAVQRQNIPQSTTPPPQTRKRTPKTRKTPPNIFSCLRANIKSPRVEINSFPSSTQRSTNTGDCRPAILRFWPAISEPGGAHAASRGGGGGGRARTREMPGGESDPPSASPVLLGGGGLDPPGRIGRARGGGA